MPSAEPVLTPKGKIFVTGGSGHVGANLVRRLLDDGHDLRCCVVPGGDTRPFEGLDVELVEADIRDYDAMKKDCAPNCLDGDADNLKLKYTLSNVALGVGVASLGAAIVIYAVAPNEPEDPSGTLALVPTADGSRLVFDGRF